MLPDEQSEVTRRMLMSAGTLVAAGAVASSAAADVLDSRPTASRSHADGRFARKVVLITGATSGIGEGTARAFAREGASVVFCGRRAALGASVEAAINADPAVVATGGRALYVRADVREEVDVARFVATARERFGGLHIAFNNAGVVFGDGQLKGGNMPIGDVPTHFFDDVWRTNTRGIFLAMKHELPLLLANAPWGRYGLRGVIINTASVSGHGGFPGIGSYSTSKHGVLGLTRDAALDYGAKGVRINSISPGGVDTPIRRASLAAQGLDVATSPAPNIQYRTNTVEEMADVVLFLADPNAPSSIMGTDIDVTMGMLTGPFAPPKPAAVGGG